MANDCGFGLIDGPFAAQLFSGFVEIDGHIVAVAVAATGLARRDAHAQAAAGLVGEVVQLKGAHRALEADKQLGDSASERLSIF